jgi:hypothetical protein
MKHHRSPLAPVVLEVDPASVLPVPRVRHDRHYDLTARRPCSTRTSRRDGLPPRDRRTNSRRALPPSSTLGLTTLIGVPAVSAAVLPQVLRLGGGHRDERATARRVTTRDESPVAGLFPHGKARARRPPRLDHLGVGAGALAHPLEQFQDQGVDGVGERGPFGAASVGQHITSCEADPFVTGTSVRGRGRVASGGSFW